MVIQNDYKELKDSKGKKTELTLAELSLLTKL